LRAQPEFPLPVLARSLFLTVVLLAAGSASAAPAPVVFAPHRAAYDLTLGTVRSAKGVAEADGRIAFEFTGSACAGYGMNFRQVTRIDDGEGKVRLSDLRTTTWENDKGTRYRFNIFGTTDGEVTQRSEGNAARSNGGDVTVNLARPRSTKLDLDDALAFPTQHMRRLIEAARAGRTLETIRFYDGSDGGEKVFDTTAFIGRPVPAGSEAGLEEPALKAGLAAVRRWPVRLSYFQPGEGDRQPLYVLSFDMFENGISGRMRLDFGDFMLVGEMRSLQLLPSGTCKK